MYKLCNVEFKIYGITTILISLRSIALNIALNDNFQK